MDNEVGCCKTLERDLFDEEMILLIWRRRTRGEGPGEFGSAEGTLNTHLPLHSAANNRAGAVPQFPACALRVPQLQSCCAEKHPPEVTGRFRRVMQGGKPKSDLPAGGRKRWHLRQPHNCHRTLHNVSPGTLLAPLPCKPPGVVQHLRCAKICACAYSHAKYWSGLSLIWWCLRRGDLDGTGIKYLNVVDQGKQCILI